MTDFPHMLQGYSIKQDTHGFWSPYLNGKVLRKEGTGVFRNPPILCNSEEEAGHEAKKHASQVVPN